VENETELNARDAWSKLIILYANHNINFKNTCKQIKFELNAGLAIDNRTSNFFQLIKNLLPGVTCWANLNGDEITDIVGKSDTGIETDSGIDTNGVGKLNIKHLKLGNFIIHCQAGHYYMENKFKEEQLQLVKDRFNSFTKDQQLIINYVLIRNNITGSIHNNVMIKFDPELLTRNLYHYIREYGRRSPPSEIFLWLLKLSITGQFDSDLRRRVTINVDLPYGKEFLNICKDNDKVFDKLKEYIYS
jgi:hypothetical protein